MYVNRDGDCVELIKFRSCIVVLIIIMKSMLQKHENY